MDRRSFGLSTCQNGPSGAQQENGCGSNQCANRPTQVNLVVSPKKYRFSSGFWLLSRRLSDTAQPRTGQFSDKPANVSALLGSLACRAGTLVAEGFGFQGERK
ncbi:MAG: hypothetical protein P8K79_12660 [Mariniblastus sp.]|nr:hypothetical protein [Mariniblastus sp.]